jgi:murein DD-endopeptidase MepM/ murein hydrolase activator NlpD
VAQFLGMPRDKVRVVWMEGPQGYGRTAADDAGCEAAVASPPPRDTTPVGPPPPRAGKTFLWPLHGRVIATFGEQGRGVQNAGINIAAPRGTPIRAAENGVVRYAGNEVRGYGNLVLVEHAGGYVTAYAHADAILVKRGDTVHRGQVIARVGATGSVTEPQLHFEIRENQGREPVDPQRYLGNPSA